MSIMGHGCKHTKVVPFSFMTRFGKGEKILEREVASLQEFGFDMMQVILVPNSLVILDTDTRQFAT